jgi:hypothetical protein
MIGVDAIRGSPHFSGIDFDVFAVGSHCLPVFIALERLAHVEGIATIVVIVRYSAIDGVS